jgi:hypothetical protein
MATVEDLTIQALARCAEYSDNFPVTRSVLYRRLGVRQQQLFSAAAHANPEFFGVIADGTLDISHRITTASMGDPLAVPPVPAIELISRIEVLASSGAGAPAVGTEIHLVPVTDPNAALAPRVTLRGGVFAPVGTDLDQVTQIRVFYSKRPFYLSPTDKSTPVELPEPFHDLLVVDLAKFMLRKMATLTQEVRAAALAALDVEEQEMAAGYLAHVKEITAAVESGRFGRTQGSTKQ